MNKKVYFLSDAHLGSASHKKLAETNKREILPLPNTQFEHSSYYPEHDVERKLCRWFDMVKADAKTIYLLGDIFDFWFEYKYVVPRGFVRVLGKIAELSDIGIAVHFFIGNHDIWLTDYLTKECGVIVHRQPLVVDIYGKKFFMAHGDGLGEPSKSFKLLRFLFHNKWCRKAFATVHPRWTMGIAKHWSDHSRATGGEVPYLGEDKEYLVQFSKKHLIAAPNINFFIFGHRHIMLDLMISRDCRVIILGDWIQYFSYGVFDGDSFSLEIFED